MKPRAWNLLGNIAGAIIILAIIAVGIWWQMFRWDECRMVEHSRLYCAMSSSG